MGKIDGVVTGIVKGLDDPQGLGRIELTFPWMSDDNKSYWAPIAAPMAGRERGAWLMPEAGDTALVAFDHGNTQHPYVLGFLWNKPDRPPLEPEGIDRNVRRFKSVAGHTLDFDDRPGSNAVRLKTAGGHEATFEDTSLIVTIKTSTGSTITLLPTGIEIDAGPGQITVTGSAVNVNAPLATFSGVIMTQSLVAQSVVSTTYSPGLGNLL